MEICVRPSVGKMLGCRGNAPGLSEVLTNRGPALRMR